MKSEWRLFGILAVFLFIATFVYAGWTDGQMGHVDWVGSTALALSTLLLLMCGGFFWFVSRRIDPRPEDRPDAEIAEGAGRSASSAPAATGRSVWPCQPASSASAWCSGSGG